MSYLFKTVVRLMPGLRALAGATAVLLALLAMTSPTVDVFIHSLTSVQQVVASTQGASGAVALDLTWWEVATPLVGLGLALILMTSRRYGRLMSSMPVILLILLLALEQVIERWHFDDQAAWRQLNLRESLIDLRSRFEQSMSGNLAELSGVAAFVSAHPDLSQDEFDRYAAAVLQHDQDLINLAAAPDLVVRYVYPLAGNEAVLGLDYRNVPDQLGPILRAIQDDRQMVTGPVNLVQGGRAFIVRSPVYRFNAEGEREFWGIVSAPVDERSVYRSAGLYSEDLKVDIAIRKYVDNGMPGPVIYGNPALFKHPDVRFKEVNITGNVWQIAGIWSEGSDQLDQRLLMIRISFAVVAVLLVLLFLLRYNALRHQRQYESTIRHNAHFLREVESVALVGGWRMSAGGDIAELSPQARQLLNIPDDNSSLSLQAFVQQFNASQRERLKDALMLALEQRQHLDLEVRSADSLRWLRLIGDSMQSEQGHWELLGAVQDITEKKAADAKIEHQANYDDLTGLPNRVLFYDRLGKAMEMSANSDKSVALLFIDLDHFKDVNDNYGHSAGDRVLIETARRIIEVVGPGCTVARHSGDEFTVIIEQLDNTDLLEVLASAVVDSLAAAHIVSGKTVYCGASIGISVYPGDTDDVEELIIKADQAMYEVKRSGRNGWQFYTEELQRRSEQRHRIQTDLIEAIQENQIQAHLQPLVDTATGLTVGCEALARWQRFDGQWIPPGQFVPIAEESGLVKDIDYRVMHQAGNALIDINHRLGSNISLSVNVSPSLFESGGEPLERWLALLFGLAQQLEVTVEITERLVLDESKQTFDVLTLMESRGVRISIDDFGTGYSSLSYLTRLPVQSLKIDRSFVDAIGTDANSEPLIETILAMAERLDLKVVAEGVENQQQLDYLTHHQCDWVQGYFLGKPMSSEAFAERIETETCGAGSPSAE